MNNNNDDKSKTLPRSLPDIDTRVAGERSASEIAEDTKELTTKERIFVREYFRNHNFKQAVLRAGWSQQEGKDALQRRHVKLAIHNASMQAADEVKVDTNRVIQYLYEFVTANLDDIVQHFKGACRYCHGSNHQYQYIDKDERIAARAQHNAKYATRKKPPEFPNGGLGFSEHAAPHEDCPKCHGQGVSRMQINDTSDNPARALISGIYQDKGVIRVETVSPAIRVKATELLMRHLGLFNKDTSSGIQITNMLTEQIKQALIPSEDEIQQQISELDT